MGFYILRILIYTKVYPMNILASKYLTNIYFFKVNNGNTRKRCEICSKLTVTPEQRRSGVFIVNFEHISQLFLVFLLLTSNK